MHSMIHSRGRSFRDGGSLKRTESLRNELGILVFAIVGPSELHGIKRLGLLVPRFCISV